MVNATPEGLGAGSGRRREPQKETIPKAKRPKKYQQAKSKRNSPLEKHAKSKRNSPLDKNYQNRQAGRRKEKKGAVVGRKKN